MRTSIVLTVAVGLLAGAVGIGEAAEPARGNEGPAGVAGTVEDASTPLAKASVYAYEMAELSMRKVLTGDDGGFRFEELPAGLYKLIAYKPGFHPSIVMLSRAAADARQFVEIRLQEETTDARDAETYWTLREQVPSDVLREIEAIRLGHEARPSGVEASRSFQGAVEAVTGYEDPGLPQASMLAGAAIDMEGRIGSLNVGVDGQYLRMAGESGATSVPSAEGEATQLALQMQGAGTGRVDLTTVTQRVGDRDVTTTEADFARYRISWSQPFGERSSSHFSAQYVSDSQFYHPRWQGPTPAAGARALRLEGVYQMDISDRASVETGLRYREHYRPENLGADTPPTLEDRTLELFGRSGMRLHPKVLVEYGLYTQLQDGSMALAPQGELVVQLDSKWQAISTASHRIEDGERPESWYWAPVPMDASNRGCDGLEEHCYRFVLARDSNDGDLLSVSALHREMAETFRLYFHDDLFRQMESLYLVRGDEIPEVQLVVQRHVTPQVVARLESTYAEGGGGLIYAFGETAAQENQVRYLVTSLDTRFARTSTGIFVAFHHLEQSLLGAEPGPEPTTTMDLERLQLMLQQDLDVLQMATDLALHLNLEVSRGRTPYSLEPSDALRRRLTGGVTLRF